MTDPTTAIDTTRLRELLRAASSFRSQSMRTAALGALRKEAAKALPALLDQLAAQAAEIKRVRAAMLSALSATRAKVDADISTELLCLGADEIRICIRRLERELASLAEYAPPGHHLHSCGGPQEACMQPGCTECGAPTMEEALAMRVRVAELERELSLAAQRNAALLSEKDAVGAVLRTDSSLAELRGRVAELEGLLREIRDSYHDNRAGGWHGAGDMLEDAICRIDTAMAKREGGR